MLEEISELESKVGLPRNFVHRLTGEDDWSFIIKLNALFEASATHLLTSKLQAPELEDSLSYLDFGNRKYGKVMLLRKLGCLSPDETKFLQMLFELRNKLAHDVRNVEFDLNRYIESLDSNQKKSFLNAVKCGNETIYWNCEEQPREKYILSHPKLLIFMAATDILLSMQLQQSKTREA